MKNNLKKLACLMALFCLTAAASAQSFLHTRGHDIVDETGKRIYLQGASLGNWLLPEGYMWKFGKYGDRPRTIEKIVEDHLGKEKAGNFWKQYRKNYITEADIKRIAELGFNSVRPALNARLFLTEGENNEFVDEGFELLDNLIGWCKKYNLYVIIDMHAALGGQTGTNIDDSPNNKCDLFTNPKNQDLLVKLWVKIAERYKDEPTVAAYDLLNEPIPESTGADKLHKDQLVPMYERLIAAIREVDKKHMFTLEGYNWSNNWSVFNKPLDNNMFYQFHYYCWDRPDNLNDITYFLKKRQELNTPVWVGETGEKNNAIYFATTQLFEHYNINWSFWPWKKMDTQNTPYSINPPEGWQDVVNYSRDNKAVTAKDPQKTFDQLLENIKLENCVYYQDVVNSLFRRLPLKIEAENYGHDGYNKSYFVKDTLSLSSNYRKKEPIKVLIINNDKKSLISEQSIILNETEWTCYNIKSLDKAKYLITMKIKANDGPAELVFALNDNSYTVKVKNTEWTEMPVRKLTFKKGDNRILVFVKKGSINFDWMNIQ